jgi:hypothetical protein
MSTERHSVDLGSEGMEGPTLSMVVSLFFLLPGMIEAGHTKQTNKLHGLSPRANYTDRATAACPRSDYKLLRIKGATWSA